MTTLNLPNGWPAPRFAFGQTVYVRATDNEPFVVVGMSCITRGRFSEPYWTFQITDRPLDACLHLFEAYYGTNILDDELSAEPWTIEGQVCDGVQHPCGKPAAYCNPQWDGSDFETRRAVDLFYCPACWAEILKIEAVPADKPLTHAERAHGIDGL